MRITEIELDNFKSFGEKTTVPILDGFTTISGPNGSGKSNIVDSLMFALGLTTTRNMRAEKLTDLINNISGRKDCAVKVTFYDETSDTKLILKRVIRSKENGYDSKYYLNDESSTLSNIHSKLAEFNISPKGYNVVMQGDVSSIISMSSGERRKIIDEIAGIADFDRKIELASKELDIVLERIESQEVILGELKNRLNQLRKDKDEAIKYNELKKQRLALEKRFLVVRINQVKEQLKNSKDSIESYESNKEKLRQENIDTNSEIHRLENELKIINQKIEELGGSKLRELGLRRDDKRTELTKAESKIEFLQKQILDYESEIKQLNRNSKQLKARIREITIKKQEFEEEKISLQANIKEQEEKYENLQKAIREKSSASDVSKQSLMEVQDEISRLKENKAKLENEHARLEEQKKLIDEQITKLREEAQIALDEIQRFESEGVGNNQNLRIDALKEQIAFLSRNIQSLKEEQKDTKEEISKQNMKLRKLESQLNIIEGQEQAANAAGYGRAVDAVLNIDGVHGTLAQLASVQDRYKTALEITCGARLRSVVCEDDYIAQECINYLKDNRLGRATFLPLNKITEAREYPLPQAPGIIDWAVNLIDYDQEYHNVFSYACSNTLIVQNLEVARRLIGRYRMVTLNGDVVERTGAMTGGSVQQKSTISFGAGAGGNNEKQQVKKQIEELNIFIKQLNQEYSQVEEQIETDRSKLEKMRSEYSDKSANANVNNSKLATAQKLYEDRKNSIAEAAQRLEEIDEGMASFTLQINQLNEDINIKDEAMDNIATSLKDSGLDILLEEAREADFETKRYQNLLNKTENEQRDLNTEEKFTQENLTDNLNKLQAAEETLIKLNNEDKPSLEADKQAIEAEITKLDTEITQVKSSMSDLNDEKESLANNLIQTNERKAKITAQIENIAIKIVETRKKIIEIQTRLDELLLEQSKLQTNEDQQEAEIQQVLSPEEIKQLQKDLEQIERRMEAMEPINMRAIEEYAQVEQRQGEIIEKQQSLGEEREMLIQKSESYKQQKIETFMDHFNQINAYFKEIFATLSFGVGQLILEDPEEVFNGGLVIKAQPRGKKMQRLEAMSGGEKSITALSFLFALQQCNPAPFYAFDEVDSALDGMNVERLSQKIKANSYNTQFIVVSHRRPMLENSNRMVGVSLNKRGFSQVIGVQNIDQSSGVPDFATA